MTIKYKGYEIWTEQTAGGFRARVHRRGKSSTIGRVLSKRPVNPEYSTVDSFRSEEAAVAEVIVWINHGTLG